MRHDQTKKRAPKRADSSSDERTRTQTPEHPDPLVENQLRHYREAQDHKNRNPRPVFGGVPGSGDLDGYSGDRLMPQSPDEQQAWADDVLEQRLLDESD
jgi:hypothetical protein